MGGTGDTLERADASGGAGAFIEMQTLEGYMRMVRGLLLGSAASLFAVAGAQAADLPVKAKPVEYVKVCSLYGAGFYYIPGTDTCIKLAGYLRADVALGTNADNSGTL